MLNKKTIEGFLKESQHHNTKAVRSNLFNLSENYVLNKKKSHETKYGEYGTAYEEFVY